MYHKIKFASLFSVLAIVSLMFSSGVQASPSSLEPNDVSNLQGGLVESKVISRAEQKAALAFWTREAVAAAPAMQLQADFSSAEVDAAALAEALSASELAGPPGFVAGGAAAPGADKAAQKAYSRDWAALAEDAIESAELSEPTGTSQVYTSYIVNKASALWKIYPHRWVGRLSFSTPSGTSYCSGTSISGNIVLTAAHCVYDSTNNTWYSNWVFTPAYRNAAAPYGTFAATSCTILTAWINLSGSFSINTWTQHDVAVCNMGNNSNGQTLNAAVGFMGRQWNQSYIRHFHDLGYPFRDYNTALITDSGKWLRTCIAEAFQQTTEVRGIGCNWGGGISGGPWVVNYTPAVVAGFADGVNSGIFVGTQNMYGARFNSNNIVPLCTAAGC